MSLIFLLDHLITGPCDCVLAYSSAAAQQLVSDTSLQKFRTMHLMGTCVLEKMSLKRPWSKLQLIKELLICMFQICWNNLHWGNFISFQASAITHPGSSQVLQSDRGWRVTNVSGNSGCTLFLLLLVLSHAWSQSSAGPKQDQTLGTVFAMSHRALPSTLSDLCWPGCSCPARTLPLPCVQDPGRFWGIARIWDVFSQRYYKFLQCELLMFSKTQAERTS